MWYKKIWNQRVNRLANFLRDGLEIRKGDRVSIYALNHVEYLHALFTCNKLGTILKDMIKEGLFYTAPSTSSRG